MANTKTTKPAAEPKAKQDTPPQFAAWRAFYTAESARILAKQPNLKGSTVQKRVSAAYKKHKKELASQGSNSSDDE